MWYCDSKYILCCHRNRCGDSYLPWLPRLHIIPFCRVLSESIASPLEDSICQRHKVPTVHFFIWLPGILFSGSNSIAWYPSEPPQPQQYMIGLHCRHTSIWSVSDFVLCHIRAPHSQTQNFQRSGKVRLHIKQQFAINKLSICVGPMLLC